MKCKRPKINTRWHSAGLGVPSVHRLKLKLLEKMANSAADQRKFWAKADIRGQKECWNWTASVNEKGYGLLKLYSSTNQKQVNTTAHRVAYFLSHRVWPKACVCHHCDNPKCVNPKHMFLGTYEDNNHDRDRKGRTGVGMKHASHKLTDEQVLDIRFLRLVEKFPRPMLVEYFKVSYNTIRAAEIGKYWKHLPFPKGVKYEKHEPIGKRDRKSGRFLRSW